MCTYSLIIEERMFCSIWRAVKSVWILYLIGIAVLDVVDLIDVASIAMYARKRHEQLLSTHAF